jgi:hypothetical protein
MQYSANQASEVTGKSTATITRAIKAGKISAKKDDAGTWQIDAAELNRVFPLQMQSIEKPQNAKDEKDVQRVKTEEDNTLREELAALRERAKAQEVLLDERAEQISDLKEDRDRWRSQATGLLSDLRAVQEKTSDSVDQIQEPTTIENQSRSWFSGLFRSKAK